MARCNRFLRRVNQAQINDLNSGTAKTVGNLFDVTDEFFAESFELRPISAESYTEKAKSESMTLLRGWHRGMVAVG